MVHILVNPNVELKVYQCKLDFLQKLTTVIMFMKISVKIGNQFCSILYVVFYYLTYEGAIDLER